MAAKVNEENIVGGDCLVSNDLYETISFRNLRLRSRWPANWTPSASPLCLSSSITVIILLYILFLKGKHIFRENKISVSSNNHKETVNANGLVVAKWLRGVTQGSAYDYINTRHSK